MTDHIQFFNISFEKKSITMRGIIGFQIWIPKWGKLDCDQISHEMIEKELLKRKRATSAYTANKTLRNLRVLFNFGISPKRKWIQNNRTKELIFFQLKKGQNISRPKKTFSK